MVILILLTSGAVLTVVYFAGARRTARDLSRSLIQQTADRAVAELDRSYGPVVRNLLIARQWGGQGLLDDSGDSRKLNALFIPMLEQFPQISSLNLANTEGFGHLLLRDMDTWTWKNRVVRTDRWGKRTLWRRWRDVENMIDEWWKELDYDPRSTRWFQGAINPEAGEEPYWTEPYTFFTTKDPGITVSIRWKTKGNNSTTYVIAFDLLLTDVSVFTTGLQVSEHGKAVVLTEDGAVIGLPRDERFQSLSEIKAAVLSPAEKLGIPVLADAVRNWKAMGTEAQEFFRFKSERAYWWGGFLPVDVGNYTLWMAVMVPEADFLAEANRRRDMVLLITLGALAVAVLMATLLARRYGRPLEELAAQSRRIRDLDLRPGDPVSSQLVEVNQLAEAQEQMLSGLQSFARYVPIDVVRELLRRGEVARIGGRTEVLTVLFTDIRGFTTIAEGMSPEALTAQMAEYFDGMLEVLHSNKATVDKFVGDAIVAFWGAPNPDTNHAKNAVKAVLLCSRRLAELNRHWEQRGLPALPTCFGINTGSVVVGNVGAPSRLSYTALGDTVNLASRLEALNRLYGTNALASESVRDAAGKQFLWRHVDLVAVKGKMRAVKIYEPLGQKDKVAEEALAFARGYEEALRLYQSRQFRQALKRLRDIETEHPQDLSISRLIEICKEYDQDPPPDDWDGVARFKVKY